MSCKKYYRVTPLGLGSFDCFGWDMPLEGSLSNDNHFLKLQSTLEINFSLNEMFHDHDLLEKVGIRLETNAYLGIHRALLHVQSPKLDPFLFISGTAVCFNFELRQKNRLER